LPAISLYSDQVLFFRSWISNPLRVAAFTPSSRSLARLITREITPAQAPVIELGPGTGVFTQALLDRGLPPTSLVLLESGEEFATILRQRFPGVQVVSGDAARLCTCDLPLEQPAGAVVSGLPLLSMTPRRIMGTLSGAFKRMRPDGCYYQFTYGPACPVPRAILERLGLQAERMGGTALNLPPANVYRIRRR
jgi:phospholipid N-methyltransferase